MTDLAWTDAALTSARPKALGALLRYFRDLDTAEGVSGGLPAGAHALAPERPAPRSSRLAHHGRTERRDRRARRARRQEALPAEDLLSECRVAAPISILEVRSRLKPAINRRRCNVDTTTCADQSSGPAKLARHEVTGGVAPYLVVSNANAAADFYVKAFGAEDIARMPPDEQGRTMHCHLRINGGSVMLSDAYPEHGCPLQPPQAFTLHLQVDDVDAWWRRAVEAGAEIVMPLQVMFWGDRYGQVRDPFGVTWSMAAPAS